MTAGLYGESFVSSVSRIESYYSCPFQHYASFGLGLRERSEYTLEAPAIGDLFHAALKWVSDEIDAAWKVLVRINKGRMLDDGEEMLLKTLHLISSTEYLSSTNRYVYIKAEVNTNYTTNDLFT